jgi:glutamyl-tRNA synthetase
MARLGSSDPIEPRATHDELIEGYDLSRYGRAPARFSPGELAALNTRILHTKPYAAVADDLAAMGVDSAIAEPFWLLVRENIDGMADVPGWWQVVTGPVTPDVPPEDAEFVAQAMAKLDAAKPWTVETWKAVTGELKAETGRKGKALFLPLRKALTGRANGPSMVELMPLLRR